MTRRDDLHISVNGETLLLDKSGAAVWPAEKTLVFADLHFEKGSAYAKRGTLLPPYDTRSTIKRMAEAIGRHKPLRVIALGDSFHDGEAADRLDPEERAMLARLAAGAEWIWVEGNHDPKPPAWIGGRVAAEIAFGGLVFRHVPAPCRPGPDQLPLMLRQAHPSRRRFAAPQDEGLGNPLTLSQSKGEGTRPGQAGEVAGHLHPATVVRRGGMSVRRRCFVSNGARLLLPSFGAYTGGLDVRDIAIASLFADGFCVYALGRERVYTVKHKPAKCGP